MSTALDGSTASSASQEGEPSTTVTLLVTLLPLVLFLVGAIFLIRLIKRSNAATDRTLEHAARMEEKTDRMIALLESIRDEKSR